MSSSDRYIRTGNVAYSVYFTIESHFTDCYVLLVCYMEHDFVVRIINTIDNAVR
jgi:hypothetical protein